jgi:hypothetical protein
MRYTGRGYAVAGLTLGAAALSAGLAAGAVAGTIGSLAGAAGDRPLVALVGALSLVLVLDAVGLRVALPQRDAETPRRWVDERRSSWAWKTGAMLGFGGLTRLGFPSWYVVPLAAVATGSPWRGAFIWGTYAFVRTGGSVALGWPRFTDRRWALSDTSFLFQANGAARRLSDLVGASTGGLIMLVAGGVL